MVGLTAGCSRRSPGSTPTTGATDGRATRGATSPVAARRRRAARPGSAAPSVTPAAATCLTSGLRSGSPMTRAAAPPAASIGTSPFTNDRDRPPAASAARSRASRTSARATAPGSGPRPTDDEATVSPGREVAPQGRSRRDPCGGPTPATTRSESPVHEGQRSADLSARLHDLGLSSQSRRHGLQQQGGASPQRQRGQPRADRADRAGRHSPRRVNQHVRRARRA